MKTPREILFKRHQGAETRLDAIRENVVTEHLATNGERARRTRSVLSPTFVIVKLWQELVWPCRRIWAGMAAAWLLVLVFHLATGEREKVVADHAPPPPDVAVALKEQRQMLAQLLDTGATAPMIRPRIPGPRSEQRQSLMVG